MQKKSSSGIQSPVGAPPPAPKANRGLLKSFNGSMLILVNKNSDAFETVDPERKGTNTGSRPGSLFRPSDLFSQARSSASSFGSRGSFSGWFPIRPTSAPLDEHSEASPINSPSGSRTSRSRSIAEDADQEKERTSSASLVVSIRKKKLDFAKKIRNKFVKRPSNLSKQEIFANQQQGKTLPSYITLLAPTTTPVRTVNHDPLASVHAANTTPSQDEKQDARETTFTSASASTATKDEVAYQNEIGDHQNEGDSETEEKAKDSPIASSEEQDDFNIRSDLLRAADKETVEILTSRIGNRAAAKTVVRIARAGEAWMREDAPRLQCLKEITQGYKHRTSREGTSSDEVQYSCLFYGEKQPKIALDRYLGRLVRYLDAFTEGNGGVDSMGIMCLLGGVVLIDRMAERTNFCLDSMNTHRVFMIATLAAFKMLDDEPCSNGYYANVGGVELAELNMLEATFLKALEFDVNLTPQTMRSVMSEFFGDALATKLYVSWYENH
jgi:hypothetical protein